MQLEEGCFNLGIEMTGSTCWIMSTVQEMRTHFFYALIMEMKLTTAVEGRELGSAV